MDQTTLTSKAEFLRTNVPLREAIQLGKRVEYFKGKRLVSLLMETSNSSHKCTREEAVNIGSLLLKGQMIHQSEVADKKKKILRPVSAVSFSEEGYYTWIYEGSKVYSNSLLAIILLCIIGGCMFPVWPQWAKVSIWYLSVTLLIAIMGLLVVRLTVFIVMWGLCCDVWILPNLFDEELGVADSFKPLASFEVAPDLKYTWMYRVAVVGAVAASCYWVLTQPTDFDEFLEMQKQMMADLYSGNLLSDMAADQETQVEIPDLSELESEYYAEAHEVDE